MKKIILASVILLLAACKQDSKESKLHKDAEAAKNQFSQAIEDSKKVAEDIAAKAEEEAEIAANAIEDAAVDLKEQAEDVKQDVEDALSD